MSIPRRLSFELEDALPRGPSSQSPVPREYDSWPCDSFFVLPDAVLAMDANVFRADLKALDPVLSASLPDWPIEDSARGFQALHTTPSYIGHGAQYDKQSPRGDVINNNRRPFTLLHNHKGLLVRSSGKGTVLIGGGGATHESSSGTSAGGHHITTTPHSPNAEDAAPSASNGPTSKSPSPPHHNAHKVPPTSSAKELSQKDGIGIVQDTKSSSITDESNCLLGVNEIFFGGEDRSSGLCYKDREERVRQMRDRQQTERQQKLEELKEQAAAAQRFREQQEAARRLRLDEMRSKDSERRTQVEERKRLIQQAEQERREAVLRKSAEREQRLELKRRQERSNAVFAFGSSTPRMLDPRENIQSLFGSRRATSTTNVNLSDSSSAIRRSSECQEADLSRKRATSAHSLNRKPDDGESERERNVPLVTTYRVADLRMSTSMYEVFNWDDADSSPSKCPLQPHAPQGEDSVTTTRPLVAPPPTAARRRTDLLPTFPSLRDPTAVSSRASPRQRSPGVRSGTVTPGSPSRSTSALSQTPGGSQVALRSRTSPRKPRPLSIAGSTLSSADKPRDQAPTLASPASPNRESRSIDRKSSTGTVTTKPLRAKSAGSDQSTPSTPAKTSRVSTPKRTPAQVKAESAAKKSTRVASAKLRSTPKTIPLQSPSMDSKSFPGSEKKAVVKGLSVDVDKPEDTVPTPVSKPENETEEEKEASAEPESQPETKAEEATVTSPVEDKDEVLITQVTEDEEAPVKSEEEVIETKEAPAPDLPEEPIDETQKPEENEETEEEKNQAQIQRGTDKPVTGYASEVEYKAALAEKRRQAREAKERELELERLRKLEEEEKERREEEEYIRLMEEQRKAEEERLQKAILEAEKQRQEEALRKEEEEIQRIETEKIEQQKKLEAEEKMRKEEEERQMRKSRVAAIMSRTRGKTASTPTKAESKTPSDETKNINSSLMSSSMTESIINNISSSMSDSMIVEAIESKRAEKTAAEVTEEEQQPEGEDFAPDPLPQTPSTGSSQPPSDVSSQPLSDFSSQPLSDFSSQPSSDVSSQVSSTVDTLVSISTQQEGFIQQETEVNLLEGDSQMSILSEDLASLNLLEAQVNGNHPVPMETTPTSQPVDLLGSFNGINGFNHNGVDSVSFQSTDRPDNHFGSLDPLNAPAQTILSAEVRNEGTTFDQIIELNQSKLANEDAVNSNPPAPFIAFEENLNKKSQQTQETSSNVPDLLL